MATVAERMSTPVVSVTPETSVLNARRLLRFHGIRHLPVVDDGLLVGMVSDRDVEIRDHQLHETLSSLQSDLLIGRYRQVGTVMSSPAIFTGPQDDLRCAARVLLERRISALPVMDRGQLVGILTLTDCVEALIERPDGQPPDDGGPRPGFGREPEVAVSR